MLTASLVVIVLAAALRVRDDQRVEFRYLPNRPLPESCVSRTALGIPCPACGLTRSFIHMTRGELRQSFAVNPVGLLLAMVIVAQIPYRLLALRSSDGRLLPERLTFPAGPALVALLLINWLARLAMFD